MQTRLFTDLIQDSLVEYAYDAELAGLSYQFNQSGDAISIVVDGYNDKMGVLLEVVTKRMREYKVDEKRFAIVVDQVRLSSSYLPPFSFLSRWTTVANEQRLDAQLRRVYENFRLEQPYQHVGFDGGILIQDLAWTVSEKLAALEQITPANLQEHIGELLARMHIESLVHGNVTEEEALGFAKTVEEAFKPEPLTPEELKSHRALVIPEGASSEPFFRLSSASFLEQVD